MTDVDALLVAVETTHRLAETGNKLCVSCAGYWPCQPVRLAAAVRDLRSHNEPTRFQRDLAAVLQRATEAMLADLREMAAGCYTGRHCEAFLDRSPR